MNFWFPTVGQMVALVLMLIAVGIVLGVGLTWLWPHLPSIRLVW